MPQLKQQALAPLLLLIFFVFGLFFESLGFRFFSIATLMGMVAAIVIMPYKHALMLTFIFISFQGFLKVVSNYHPAVHVGADLIVVFLLLKVLFQLVTSRLIESEARPPLTKLILVHFAWVVVLYFHPHALGFIPSIVGSKIYITMTLLYFFGYYVIKDLDDVRDFFRLFVGLAVIHLCFTLYQGFVGPESVLSIHPRYAAQLEKYAALAFRPFGLTNLPGGPPIYIYSSLPFILYFMFMSRHLLVSLVLSLTLPLSGLAFLFCQVRSAIIKSIVALALFTFGVLAKLELRPATRFKLSLGAVFALALTLVAIPYLMSLSVDSYDDNQRAFERSLSSFDINTMSEARQGNLDRFLLYLKHIPFGVGFSRVGASAGFFAAKYSHKQSAELVPGRPIFSDNLWVTFLIELGLPGLLIMALILGAIMWKGVSLWRDKWPQSIVAPALAIYAALFAIALGSYAAEGIIYNPESAFFWFFSGVLMRITNPQFKKEYEDHESIHLNPSL